jgi:uncharacterized protein YoaH (UPF0181 family)
MNKSITDDLINRIQKLFALGQSSNMNEAQAAIDKAQELMNKYGLSYGQVNYTADSYKTNGSRIYQWELDILNAVCYANNCEASFCRKGPNPGSYWIVGRKINVYLSLEMFKYLIDSVKRLAKCQCAGKGKKYIWDFKAACAFTLHDKFMKYAAQLSWAVDRVNELKSISEYTQIDFEKRKPTRFNFIESYRAGRKAAEDISFAKQSGIDKSRLLGALSQ